MDIQEELKYYLMETFPDAKSASNGREVVIRCRFCGDSKNKDSRHLYLSLGDSVKGIPPLYHCFKCNESGVLSKDVIRELMGYADTSEVLYKLDKSNKEIFKNSKYRPVNNNYYLNQNYPYTDNTYNKKKIEYISNRLGIDFSYGEIISNKIILDVKELLSYNKINVENRFRDLIDYASLNCIGFLSMNNSFVTFRNLRKNPPRQFNFRYMQYNIFNSFESGNKYYCIPTIINTMSNEPIHIRIAEGAFDILSVKYNLCGGNTEQQMYISANGKGFSSVIKHVLTTYPIPNLILDLYLDNDYGNDYAIWNCKKALELNIPVYLHRNGFEGEKDFGVPANKIREQVLKV